MLKLIGVLLLSGELSVAVERHSGYVEQRFACTKPGVEQLFDFVLGSIGPGEPAIHFVVGPIERQAECPLFFATLADFGIANGAVGAAELERYLLARAGDKMSASSVAEVFREKNPRLLKRR
jgi:hypothetical protein